MDINPPILPFTLNVVVIYYFEKFVPTYQATRRQMYNSLPSQAQIFSVTNVCHPVQNLFHKVK
jgi:hypothetical protein